MSIEQDSVVSQTPQSGSSAAVGGLPCWFPPIGPGPTYPYPPQASRAAAMAMGELHGSLVRKALARFEACGHDKVRFAQDQLDRIHMLGLIQDHERRTLTEVLALAKRADEGDERASREIQKHYQRLIDEEASPTAVLIGGIAFSSTTGVSKGVGTSDVQGTLTGIIAGVATGAGALIGGLVGGAAMSIAAAVDKG